MRASTLSHKIIVYPAKGPRQDSPRANLDWRAAVSHLVELSTASPALERLAAHLVQSH